MNLIPLLIPLLTLISLALSSLCFADSNNSASLLLTFPVQNQIPDTVLKHGELIAQKIESTQTQSSDKIKFRDVLICGFASAAFIAGIAYLGCIDFKGRKFLAEIAGVGFFGIDGGYREYSDDAWDTQKLAGHAAVAFYSAGVKIEAQISGLVIEPLDSK